MPSFETQKEEQKASVKLAFVPTVESARADILKRTEDMVRKSTHDLTILGKIGESEIIRNGYYAIGLRNLTKPQWKSVARGEFFLIHEYTDKMGITSRSILGTAEEFGVNDKTLKAAFHNGYTTGALPGLEKVISESESKGTHTKRIYVARVADCLQFVNLALGSTARSVSADPNKDVLKAASLDQSYVVSLPQKNIDTVSAAFSKAKIGDALVFLEKQRFRNVGESREFENMGIGTVIWLDANNNIVDVSKMKNREKPEATPFTVTHSAVFAGSDADGPLVSQAHIFAGTIVTEALTPYLASNGKIAGVAVISADFFTGESKGRILVADVSN